MSSKNKQTKLGENRSLSLRFCQSVSIWLSRRDSHICFCIQPVQFLLLWLKYIKRSFPERDVVGKGRRRLVVFSDNFRHSYLILQYNPTSCSLLKVNCSMECETVATVRSNDPCCTLNSSFPMHDFVTSCINHLENTGSLSYAEFPIRNSHLSISTYLDDLIRKVFKYQKAAKPKVADKSCRKF